MPQIHILPEHLANQIAAGEVIERPASVIKELLENSLDAGATRLEVEAEGGGTRLLRVIDNGYGMDEDDVLLSLERHGTSKIHEAADLGNITTLGFRGEAIPSIAAVSRFTIVSRRENAELGTKAVMEYGKLTSVHAAGCAQGTVMEARALFGNTPARRKFLRSARTELHHIEEIVRTYALSHTQAGFALRVDGREVFVLPPGQTLEDRLRALLKSAPAFIAVNHNNENLAIHGLLLPPEQGASSGAMLRLFVNGRAVRDRLFSHAVAEGMTGFLMKGRFAAGVLHLTLPPGDVDVNVHPAKHEVRFRYGQEVHAFIVLAVRHAMRMEQRNYQEKIFSPALRPEVEPMPQEAPPGLTQRWPSEAADEAPATAEPASPTGYGSPLPPIPPSRQETGDRKRGTGGDYGPVFPARPTPPTAPSPPAPTKVFTASDDMAGLRLIGQAANLYIICENQDGLVIIDQHAAHERLLYEELLASYQARQLAGQRLLFPVSLELSPRQGQVLEQRREEFTRLGFEIEEFGGATHIIKTVPAFSAASDPAALFIELLRQFSDDKGDHARLLEDILAAMVCKAAVKSGREMSEEEIRALLKKMAKADLFSHCPH
ncbi:MAG TPA: DNA mismatch repair endonuclease MutL, partial [Desulfobulbaceae bacterium]|nr:DNA mismatch repair endonuclease MutL [Desulfobulbaceae bacterium]